MTETDIRENASNARRREIADLRAEVERLRRARDSWCDSLEQAEAQADSSEHEVARLRQELADLASDSPHIAAKYWRQRKEALHDRDVALTGLRDANMEIERLQQVADKAQLELDRERLANDYGPEGVDIVMGKLQEWRERAEAAEAKIARVEARHRRVAWPPLLATFGQTEFPDRCEHCRVVWPCETVTALADPAPEQTGGEA